MPDIVSKTIHVRFSTQQRATLADQMADVQSQIDGVEDEKKKAMAGFNARLKVLRARMHEYATAVREGEGDIVVDCLWKFDANKPLEHLWRLDTMEIVESRPLTGKAAKKAAEAARQLDLVTPTPAGAGDGRAVAAGGTPGEQPAREAARVLRLRVGPTPPCPAPVPGAPGGICGADGDPDFFAGFCKAHHDALPEPDRVAILEAIAEVRRQMKTQQAAERRAKKQQIATAAEEDAARDAAHKAADEASGAALDAIGGPLGCARAIEEGKGGEGEPVKAPETDDDYRARVKVAIDQAHKAATARASTKPAPAPEVTGEGAVPPIVREKPRELTPDLIAQLAEASRQAGDATVPAAEVPVPEGEPAAAPEPVVVPVNDAPPALGDECDEEPEDDNGPAPGNEAEPPPPADEELDGPQPLYNQRRPDGWPLCPRCGEDELYSPAIPPTEATIVRCDACGWRPPTEAIPTRPALPLDTTTHRAPFAPGHQVLHVGGVDIDTSGLLDHGRLLRNGPCKHSDDVGPCVACTRAAVEEERARLAQAGTPPLPAGPVSDEARQLAERSAAAAPEWCAALRRQVTAAEKAEGKATCACGKVVAIRPVTEDGAWVATLPKHKRAEPTS